MSLVPLGKISEVKSGFAFKSEDYAATGIRLVRIGNLNGKEINFNNDSIYIENSLALNVEEFLLKENDVLIAMSGATTGKVALVKEIDLPCLLNQRVGRFSVNVDELDAKYLFYFLSHSNVKERILKVSGGSAQPNVSPSQLKELEIPLPNLTTQKEIAQLLEEADIVLQKRKAVNALADQFLQSTFRSMFGDPISNENGFDKPSIADLKCQVQIGPFGTQLHVEDYIENGIPLINPTHIQEKKVVESSTLTITKDKHADLSNYHLKDGDIIMARRGEMARCAIITKREENWLCGTGSLFIRPPEHLNSVFLLYVLSHSSIKRKLENDAQGVTMANLNKTIIENLEIINPPHPLQQQFASIVAHTEQLREKQKQSEIELENLFRALLQKYFG